MHKPNIEKVKEFTQGLRDLADWYDAHPEVPLPENRMRIMSYCDTKEELATIVRAMGHCTKSVYEDILNVERNFGPVILRTVSLRDKVCEKVLVGQREIERTIVLESKKETVLEDVYEWKCPPLLKGEE